MTLEEYEDLIESGAELRWRLLRPLCEAVMGDLEREILESIDKKTGVKPAVGDGAGA